MSDAMDPFIPPPVRVDVLADAFGEVDGGDALGSGMIPAGGWR